MTKHELHSASLLVIANLLRAIFPTDGFVIREEKSLSHDNRSLPEPDVAVVPGDWREIRSRPPSTSDAVLIVEVCQSSKRADYRDKLTLYAEAGAPSYWIVDLDQRKITVHTEPAGQGLASRFARVETFAEDASVPVVLDGREIGRIAVKDVLPRSS